MNYLTTRIDKLEQAAGVETRSNYCDCPVITFVVGTDNSDFFAHHPACGKPIDRVSRETVVVLPVVGD
jgi:hypothetical protein